ncbi:hypothetical protein RDV89_00445 [Nocardioides zeae]|uniref:Restriction system protein Mrr-like N-terminal domain-containing protein n=1 Tax=Nocardioides imazamoxiresistens TaxID=3231893 RepID=A0ABU3PQM2_9ACTN|nr:hypothetical protein [Nocardioides zeae]MDT9591514.1 hypothetical protein [Nocardioides zeae]
MSADKWCEFCEMSLVSCPHGAPKPPPPAETPPLERVRTRATTGTSGTTGAAPRTTRTPVSARRVPGTPAPAPVRRAPVVRPGRTPQGAFRPYLLATLADHDGRLERDLALEEVGRRMADVLQRDDLGIGPSGEVRWRTVALKERRALVDAGLVGSAGPGLWELTSAGYETLAVFRAAQEQAEQEQAEASDDPETGTAD